jgi:threonyl-tRNA synthetase
MAMAVQSIFKEAKCTIGPWIEKGFYYDFAFENAFSDKDLKKIKKQMDKIIRKDLPLTKEEVRSWGSACHQTLTFANRDVLRGVCVWGGGFPQLTAAHHT